MCLGPVQWAPWCQRLERGKYDEEAEKGAEADQKLVFH
jgi:hypothetical protein